MSLDASDKLALMIVDDEPDNLDLLYRTFRRDFKVYQATSGFEALKLLDQLGDIAVIISDQRMPRMNGTEFLSRTVERFPDTIRIVLTGYTDVEDLVEAINSGQVFKYITKPWNPQKLKEVVVQAAETYRVVKQRTRVLTRALRRESLVNDVLSAVRESLNYESTLQTVVSTLTQAFKADYGVLCPWGINPPTAEGPALFAAAPTSVPPSAALLAVLNQHHLKRSEEALPERPFVIETLNLEGSSIAAITVILLHQQQCLAVISLYRMQQPKWGRDVPELVGSIAEQVALAIAQAKLHQQVQEQSRQMRSELEVARQVQTNLLRQNWPAVEGVRLQARCRPAREVGGDFFEVFATSGDVWLAVGDVAGKGIPAALFMASAIAVLRQELSHHPPSPEVVMQRLNQSLSADLVSNNCFITLVLARYTPATGKLVYANAGHILPLVWSSPQQAQPTYLETRGVPLGILPVWSAPAGAVDLVPGDTLLLTSDGLTEATVIRDRQNSLLQQAGLWRILQRQPAHLDLDWLLAEIQALGSPEQEDDQTVLSLEVQQ
ncbi:fused response regulator/phosphatase [filamentous cyanobacterium CCP5]|nr:fused response regulator/phosphatase [filamentous cyanobacterium CCP5]